MKRILAAVPLLVAALAIHAQVTPLTIIGVSNLPSILQNGTSNVLSVCEWKLGEPLALSLLFNRTNAGTSNVTVTIDWSVDGTNYCTTNRTYTVAGNGTTAVRTYWLLLPTEYDCARYVRLKTIGAADAANSVFPSNAIWIRKP